MTFDFLKRKSEQPEQPVSRGLPDPGILTEEPPAEDYELKIDLSGPVQQGCPLRAG